MQWNAKIVAEGGELEVDRERQRLILLKIPECSLHGAEHAKISRIETAIALEERL